jgi:hypothetical protein
MVQVNEELEQHDFADKHLKPLQGHLNFRNNFKMGGARAALNYLKFHWYRCYFPCTSKSCQTSRITVQGKAASWLYKSASQLNVARVNR